MGIGEIVGRVFESGAKRAAQPLEASAKRLDDRASSEIEAHYADRATLAAGEIRPVPLQALHGKGERAFLGPGGSPRLVPIGPFNAQGEPIVFVHGILADPTDQAKAIADALAHGKQVWVMAYRAMGKGAGMEENAKVFASEFQKLSQRGASKITIVGHSLGGMTTKAAFTHMADGAGQLKGFKQIDFVGMTVPWGGISWGGWTVKIPDRFLPSLDFLRDTAPNGAYWQRMAHAKLPTGVRMTDIKADTDEVVASARGFRNVPTLRDAVVSQAEQRYVIHGVGHMAAQDTPEARALLLQGVQPVDRANTWRDHLHGIMAELMRGKQLLATLWQRRSLSA